MADNIEELKKKCKDCNLDKKLSDFQYVKTRNIYEARCRKCKNIKQNNYLKSRPDLIEKNRINAKKYYLKDVEKAKEYRRQHYRKQDRERMLASRKEWYINNKQKHAQKRAEYESANKDRLRAARRKWENNRLSNDINYRMNKVLSSRIRHELKGDRKNTERTEALIGCTINELKSFIESQFEKEMTWDNWGTNGWHIDHRIPLSWFNLENENCRKLAFNYKNLQPLWSKDNLNKKNFYAHKLAI